LVDGTVTLTKPTLPAGEGVDISAEMTHIRVLDRVGGEHACKGRPALDDVSEEAEKPNKSEIGEALGRGPGYAKTGPAIADRSVSLTAAF